MGEVLSYAVAKYVPDLLRQEPRNIGVFVWNERGAAARLMGELEPGLVIFAAVKRDLFQDEQLYYTWQRYWRGLVNSFGSAEEFSRALYEDKGAFSVWAGGELQMATAGEDLNAVANDLFARMVDEPRLSESAPATTDADRPTRSRRLAQNIQAEFRRLRIMEPRPSEKRRNQNLFVRHPVQVKPRIEGTLAEPHTPTFYQQNGKRYVMEHVDFAVPQEYTARDHAAYAAFMFGDLLEKATKERSAEELELIAIVNRSLADYMAATQRYGLSAIGGVDSSVRIVHWDDEFERAAFLAERSRIADPLK